jgi:Fe-S cluster biogenesis protein NfuA
MSEAGLRLALEPTPNPAARRIALETGAKTATTWTVAGTAPALAAGLLALEGVAEVTAGPGFLTVRADSPARWEAPSFGTAVLGVLLDGCLRGLALAEEAPAAGVDHDAADADVVRRIQLLIEERLRPYVEADGGEIALVAFRDGVARVALRGACSGCPSSAGTLRVGVERLLRHYVPEVLRVESA